MGKQMEMPSGQSTQQQTQERKSDTPILDSIIASADSGGLGAMKVDSFGDSATWGQAATMCRLIRRARIAPKELLENEAALMVAVLTLIEKKISVFAGIQSVYVINNRVTMFGTLVLGLCQGSQVWDAKAHSEVFAGTGDALEATCTMGRKDGEKIEKSFGLADAKRAGLLKNGTYEKYPKDMLMWRARHACIKACFADVTQGFGIYEIEKETTPEPAASPSETMRLPRRKPVTATEDTIPAEEPTPEPKNGNGHAYPCNLSAEAFSEWMSRARDAGMDEETLRGHMALNTLQDGSLDADAMEGVLR